MKRVWSIVLAVAVVALALVYGLLGIVLAALTCDESCEDPPEVWRDDPSAWQWDALAAFGLAAVAASIVFLVAIALRRRYMGWIALVSTGLAVAGFVAIETASGLGILGLVTVALVGGGAIALLPEREPPVSAA
jgi:archaellum biogenesis protein FlaJ (TadC family)